MVEARSASAGNSSSSRKTGKMRSGMTSPRTLVVQRAHEMFPNTAAFDITPHPAMTIPCGLSDGLPIGLMFVGRQYEESTIYRAAYAFEQAEDWRTL
jgi:amidase